MKQESQHPAWFCTLKRHIFKINHMFISSALAGSECLTKAMQVCKRREAKVGRNSFGFSRTGENNNQNAIKKKEE